MKNKNNILKCSKCEKENPLFSYNCKYCGNTLRDRVVNIDFWKTILSLIENPTRAFISVIQSEHKNFIIPLLLLIALKNFLYAFYVNSFLTEQINLNFTKFIFAIILTIVSIIIFSFLLKLILMLNNIQTRFKDNFSLLIYSLFPLAFSLLFLTILEFSVFGNNLFLSISSLYYINSTLFFIFLIIEILFLIWSTILMIIGINVQLNKIFLSIIYGIVVNLSLPILQIIFIHNFS